MENGGEPRKPRPAGSDDHGRDGSTDVTVVSPTIIGMNGQSTTQSW